MTWLSRKSATLTCMGFQICPQKCRPECAVRLVNFGQWEIGEIVVRCLPVQKNSAGSQAVATP